MRAKIVTARMNKEILLQIEYLKEHYHTRNMTQILIKAVHHLYENVKQHKVQLTPFEMFEQANLIGVFEGERNLSENYKSQLRDGLNEKYPIDLKSKRKKK